MAIYFYDQAVKQKIQRWVKDPNMTITDPDETRRLFEYTADVNNDKPSIIKLDNTSISCFFILPG